MRLTCRAVSWALKEKSMRTPLLAGLKDGPKRAAELAQQVNAPIVDVVRTLKALKGEGLIWRVESGEGAVLDPEAAGRPRAAAGAQAAVTTQCREPRAAHLERSPAWARSPDRAASVRGRRLRHAGAELVDWRGADLPGRVFDARARGRGTDAARRRAGRPRLSRAGPRLRTEMARPWRNE